MPPFLAAILATVAGNVGSELAAERIRALLARRAAIVARRPDHVPQVAPRRAVLTPPVGRAPVPFLPGYPTPPAELAGRLADRRRA